MTGEAARRVLPNYRRRGAPLLLAEQLLAWSLYHQGEPVNQIAQRISRTVIEARAILSGDMA